MFSSVPKEKRKRLFSFFVLLYFLVNALLPFLSDTVLPFPIEIRDLVDFGSRYVFYVLAGYLLHTYDFSVWQRRAIYGLAAVGLLAHIWGTYTLSMRAGEIIETYKGYLNVPCILYSVGIFVFSKEFAAHINSKQVLRGLHWLKQYTFSVYLLHTLVLTSLKRILPVDETQLWWRLGAPLLVIGICIAVTYCARKCRPLRAILP